MIGKVTVWHMTEEERLAYIKKHPIISDKPKGSSFASLDDQVQEKGKSRRKARWGYDGYNEK